MVGSYSSVNVRELNTLPFETIDQHLSGNTAGLFSIKHSGRPGDGDYLSLRGFKSPYTNGQPLIIVDGMIFEPAGITSNH